MRRAGDAAEAPDPTAVRQANSTFSAHSGARPDDLHQDAGDDVVRRGHLLRITDTHRLRCLILASASPRRAELLTRRRDPVRDAARRTWTRRRCAGEPPDDYVAAPGAREGRGRGAHRHPGRLVLGADTTVVVDGAILGKPADAAEAARRCCERLAGRPHEVLTGVALAGPGEPAVAVASTARLVRAHDIRRHRVVRRRRASGATRPAPMGFRAGCRDSSPGSRARTRTSSGCRSSLVCGPADALS